MIESFAQATLEQMREVYAGFTVETIIPVTAEMAELIEECGDTALQQLAGGRIRFLSMTAIVECWMRGLETNI